MKPINYILLCLFFLSTHVLQAQVEQQKDGSYKATLSDGMGTEVLVFAAKPNDRGKLPFYYLPTNLRVSVQDTTPEFSFMPFGEGEEISGGLMHCLLKWGLGRTELKELRHLLRTQVDSNAVLYGSVTVEQFDEGPDFELSSNTELGEILNKSLTNKSQVPLNAGGKLALSFLFSAKDAQTIAEQINDPEKLKEESICIYLKCRITNGKSFFYQVVNLEKNLDELFYWLETQK